MKDDLKQIQTGLAGMGHNPGPIDGLWGKRTLAAMQSLIDLNGRPRVMAMPDLPKEAPWVTEGKKLLGRHEVTDNSFLRRWLKSDGKTLGDPAQLPWCGDFVETCIRLALPSEPFPGALGENPYWARNWTLLGEPTAPTLYCVMAFQRPGGGGHVGFCMGQDDTRYFVLGGNQSNRVTIAPIDKGRLLPGGARWPSTWPKGTISLLRMTSAEASSINES